MIALSAELEKEIVRRIVEALHPVRIYLFGSHGYGMPHPDSDVDLLVVVRDAETSCSELIDQGRQSLWGMRIPVDLLVCTSAQMGKWADVPCNLFHTVSQKGRLIYAASG